MLPPHLFVCGQSEFQFLINFLFLPPLSVYSSTLSQAERIVDALIKSVCRKREDGQQCEEPTHLSRQSSGRASGAASTLPDMDEEDMAASSTPRKIERTSRRSPDMALARIPMNPQGPLSPTSPRSPPPFPQDMLRSRRQSQTIEMSLAIINATEALMEKDGDHNASAADASESWVPAAPKGPLSLSTSTLSRANSSRHSPLKSSTVLSDFHQVYAFLHGRSSHLPTAEEFVQSMGRSICRDDLVDLISVVCTGCDFGQDFSRAFHFIVNILKLSLLSSLCFRRRVSTPSSSLACCPTRSRRANT